MIYGWTNRRGRSSIPPMKRPRLITISFSHYCEKARWALDHARVPYVEESHLPGFHIRPTRKAGGRTVPVLVTPEKTLTGLGRHRPLRRRARERGTEALSSDPDARREVDAVEALCNGELARASRLFVYHHALPDPERWSARCARASRRFRRRSFRTSRPSSPADPPQVPRRPRPGRGGRRDPAALFAELGARLGSLRSSSANLLGGRPDVRVRHRPGPPSPGSPVVLQHPRRGPDPLQAIVLSSAPPPPASTRRRCTANGAHAKNA